MPIGVTLVCRSWLKLATALQGLVQHPYKMLVTSNLDPLLSSHSSEPHTSGRLESKWPLGEVATVASLIFRLANTDPCSPQQEVTHWIILAALSRKVIRIFMVAQELSAH